MLRAHRYSKQLFAKKSEPNSTDKKDENTRKQQMSGVWTWDGVSVCGDDNDNDSHQNDGSRWI